MNSTINNQSCILTDTFLIAADRLNIFTFYVMSLIHFLFGLSIHILFVYVLWQHSKKETPYIYQVYLICSEAIYILAFNFWCVYNVCQHFPKCPSNFFIMYGGIFVSVPLIEVCSTTSLLLAIGMSSDRIFALALPMKYKSHRRKLHQRLALFLCVSIGCAVNICNFFNKKLDWIGESEIYVFSRNLNYISSMLGRVLNDIQVGTRIFGVVLLILLNLILVTLYRQRMKKSSALIASRKLTGEEEKERTKERNIVILTTCQSILILVDMIGPIFWYIMLFFFNFEFNCYYQIILPVVDILMMVSSTVNLYMLVIFSTPMSNIFKQELKFLSSNNAVAPIALALNQ